MAYFVGTYIQTGTLSGDMYNDLVDNYLTPRLLAFRQIQIYDEVATLKTDRATWKATFGNWNTGAELRVRKGGVVLMDSQVTDIDYAHGTYKANPVDIGPDGRARDMVETTYEFDYFPSAVLAMFCDQALSIANSAGWGSATGWSVSDMPTYWKGVVADLAFALAIERILLDYDLWKYRLVYAIGPNDVESSGGDIVNQLQTLKQNAEERANKTLENEKFKPGNYTSSPTVYYYDSVRGAGTSSGRHGIPFAGGRLRGWRPNRFQ